MVIIAANAGGSWSPIGDVDADHFALGWAERTAIAPDFACILSGIDKLACCL